jgi:hypothetical protein
MRPRCRKEVVMTRNTQVLLVRPVLILLAIVLCGPPCAYASVWVSHGPQDASIS